jgi:hypothetical protein
MRPDMSVLFCEDASEHFVIWTVSTETDTTLVCLCETFRSQISVQKPIILDWKFSWCLSVLRGTFRNSTINKVIIASFHIPSNSLYTTHPIIGRYITWTIITNFMELSPSWEATDWAATQELPSIYRTRRFITVFTRAPSLVPILNQINPVHITPSYLS